MHHIQDVILTGGSLIFVAALIPTLRGNDKPALSTSLLTGSVLVVFAGVYVSLALWFSAITTFITAACWFMLAAQKARLRRLPPKT
jgi:uncharacterized membrane protein YqgA involved in biofilm formation